MPIVKPPVPLDSLDWSVPSVFLAGSIEMGIAEDWQTRAGTAICAHVDALVLNPRRDSWDASWEQSYDNPMFREQVQWELSGLERADHVLLFLSPGTKSPITLLELGLHARSGRLIVACPEGFWRRGNVQTVCHRYRVPMFDALEDALEALRNRIDQVRAFQTSIHTAS